MAKAVGSILVSLLFIVFTTCNANINSTNELYENINSIEKGGRKLLEESNGHHQGHNGGHGGHRRVVVALDGSGDYRSIKEAVNAARGSSSGGRFEIYVKKGRYNEYVQVPEDAKDITMVGDGIGNTVIVGNKHAGQPGVGMSTSATFAVEGDGFIAKGITFQNTAGHVGQAVALSSRADKVAFYKCSFEGYQDTLYLYQGKHFFQQCDIYGSMDMICGDATAVFQNCNIHLRPHNNSQVVITAQKRESQHESSGFVVQNSRIIRTDELKKSREGAKVFLGRPWGKYSRTVYLKNYFDGVDPQGWTVMGENKGGGDVYYAEFENSGPGADTGRRVGWSGVRAIDENEAEQFTVRRFIEGESWLGDTELPYNLDL